MVPARWRGISENFCSLCSYPSTKTCHWNGNRWSSWIKFKGLKRVHITWCPHCLGFISLFRLRTWIRHPLAYVTATDFIGTVKVALPTWMVTHGFSCQQGLSAAVKFNSVQSLHLASKFFDSVSESTNYSDEAWARIDERSIHTPKMKSMFSFHTSEVKYFGL